jgi:hypothetical protein
MHQCRIYSAALFVLAFLVIPSHVRAQAVIKPLFSSLEAVAVPFARDTVRESAEEGLDPVSSSSLFMGVVGALGGAAIGGGQTSSSCSKVCRSRTAAAGAAIGAGALIPLGAHLGNKGKGNLLLSTLATSVVGLAGYGLASAVPGHPTGAIVFLTAPIQVVLASKVEKSTTRH